MNAWVLKVLISVVVLCVSGCTPLLNYVASGKDSPRDETVVYLDENGIRLKLSGFIYYINQSPEVYETILKINGRSLEEQIEILPESVGVDFYHQGRSLIESGKATITKTFTSANVCGDNKYPDKIRAGGLPSPIIVASGCWFTMTYRYIFEMPSAPKEIEVRSEFEYKTRTENVKASNAMEVKLNRTNFWWVYAT